MGQAWPDFGRRRAVFDQIRAELARHGADLWQTFARWGLAFRALRPCLRARPQLGGEGPATLACGLPSAASISLARLRCLQHDIPGAAEG